jgi:hypothetical protein
MRIRTPAVETLQTQGQTWQSEQPRTFLQRAKQQKTSTIWFFLKRGDIFN